MLLVAATLLTFQLVDSGLPHTGMWRHGFAVADMNGDSRPDLVFTSPRKQPGPPRIFLNQGNNRFEKWNEATFPALLFDYGAVAAADFDGNGTTDLAVGCHYIGVVVLYGDGKGTFAAAPNGFIYPSPFSSRALTVIDWNGDGRPDVAALSDGPRPGRSVTLGVVVFENLGSAWKTAQAAIRDVVHGESIAAGDFDGDGLTDLVTASVNIADLRVLRLGSDGALARRTIDTGIPPYTVRAVATADLDGNGLDEVVIGYTGGTPRVSSIELLSFPAGSRPPVQVWSDANESINDLATGDFDGDGAIDVVAALAGGRLLTFRGDGQGSVLRGADIPPSAWRPGCDAYAVRVADLDGDGRGEIIAAFAGESNCPSGGGVEVWRTQSVQPRRRSARH